MLVEVNVLDGVKDLRSEVTLVDVIVLRSHMDHKLNAAIFSALGNGLDLLYIDLSLDLVLFDVVQRFVCQEQNSALLLHPSVDFDDDA